MRLVVPASLIRARPRIDTLSFVCSLVAAGMLLAAAWLPLWEMDLHAPQYPQGLQVTAYGTRLEGDLQEVNALNHYVGVAPIEPGDISELRLFPYAVAALVFALLLGGIIVRARLWRAVLSLGLWGFAGGFLLDLQWWLYQAGHDLNPEAPMRIPEFTPKVVGSTQVVNFRSETMPAEGFWLIIGAAALVSFGPPLVRFLVASWRNTGDARPAPAQVPAHARSARH